MIKRVVILAVISLTAGLVALPGVASATCTSTFTGAGYPRLFNYANCTDSYYDVQQNQSNLTFVGFNDKTASVQTVANGDGVEGWVNSGYMGTHRVLAASSSQARWVSFDNEPALKDQTSSVMRIP